MKKLVMLFMTITVLVTLAGCSTGQGIQNSPKDTGVQTAAPKENNPPAESPPPTPEEISLRTFNLAQLQEDFKQLQSAIETAHPRLYTDMAELNGLFQSQYALLRDGMNEADFYRVLAPVNAAIRCQHTKISVPSNFMNYISEKGLFLPAAIKIINSRAYVYKSLDPSALPAGVEVVSINGKKVPDVLKTLMQNLPADGTNETEKLALINLAFQEAYYLYIETPESFNIEYIDAATREIKTAAIPAAGKEQMKETLKITIPFKPPQVTPLDQKFLDTYAVLTVKTFSDTTTFDSFMDSFFKSLAEKQIKNLIIDVRDNWGGDPVCAAYLFSYLTGEPAPFMSEKYSGSYVSLVKPVAPAANAFRGKVYVLINGGCNSSTGFFCALLKYHKIATFIGEETGGGSTCTAMTQVITLKNTGISFNCATEIYGVAVPGKLTGRGTMPDQTITPTIEDMISGKDVVMEHAVDLILKTNK